MSATKKKKERLKKKSTKKRAAAWTAAKYGALIGGASGIAEIPFDYMRQYDDLSFPRVPNPKGPLTWADIGRFQWARPIRRRSWKEGLLRRTLRRSTIRAVGLGSVGALTTQLVPASLNAYYAMSKAPVRKRRKKRSRASPR